MRYLFLFILFISSLRIHSQSLNFYSGPRIEEYDDNTFRFFDQDSLHLYASHHVYQNYYIDVYEKESLKKILIIKIPTSFKNTISYNIEDVFIRDEIFQVLYSYFDEDNKSENLEMVTFDRSGLKIGETKLIDKSEGKNEKQAGRFSIINYKRYSEFLSYGYKYLKDTSIINIDHFDYSGNRTKSQNFLLANNSGYSISSLIDLDCNLYHLTRSKSGKRNVNWSVRIYSPNINECKVIDLIEPSLKDINISNFSKSFFDRENHAYFISPYTLELTSKAAEGIYLVKVDTKTHTLIKEIVIPFKVKSEKNNIEGDFALSSCIIVDVIPFNENNLKIVFESRLETTATMYGITIEREYEIGNIITVDIDSNHIVKEIHKIRKQQHTSKTNYKYTGFSILNNENKSYFIYNELPENLQRTPDKMKKVNSSKIDETVVIYTVVDSNKVKRKVLINKDPKSGIDAILPNSYIVDNYKNQIYLLRKIRADIFLTKIFVNN